MKEHLSFDKISDFSDGFPVDGSSEHFSSCSICSKSLEDLKKIKTYLKHATTYKITDLSFDENVMKYCKSRSRFLKKRHIIPIAAAASFVLIMSSIMLRNSVSDQQMIADSSANGTVVVGAKNFNTVAVSSVKELKSVMKNARIIAVGHNSVTVEASPFEYQRILDVLSIVDTGSFFKMQSGLKTVDIDGRDVVKKSGKNIIFTVNIDSGK